MTTLHIVCPVCHRTNRVPTARIVEQPKCGACQALLVDGKPADLNADDFHRHREHSDLPLVVDFWAPWCGPCRQMAPAFVQVAGDLRGRAQFAKVNTETEGALASQYNIRSIPTLVISRGGREVARMSGALDAIRLRAWIEQSLSG
jgi:thioredoxin 2